MTKENISYDYDEIADVMYITFGKPDDCISFEYRMESNIIIRHKISNGEINGITILDFKNVTGLNKEKKNG